MADSLSVSEYEDCIDQASNDSRRRRKKDRNKKTYKLILRKKELCVNRTIRKSNQRSRNIERKQNERVQPDIQGCNEVESAVSLPKDRIRQYSNMSHDDESNEITVSMSPDPMMNIGDSRVNYIDTMTKLIKLNMPSYREINRSNEAFMNREDFFEKRRRNTRININSIDKNDQTDSNQLFSTPEFWQELVKCIDLKTAEQIQKGQTKFPLLLNSILHFNLNLEIDENDRMEVKNLNNDEDYLLTFKSSYLQNIDSAYKAISVLLSSYQNTLSNWPTSRDAFRYLAKSDIENGGNKNIDNSNQNDEEALFPGHPDYIVEVQENMNTLQAWQTCCELLTSTIHQIFQLIGVNYHESNHLESSTAFWFQKFVYQHMKNDDVEDDDEDCEGMIDVPESNGNLDYMIHNDDDNDNANLSYSRIQSNSRRNSQSQAFTRSRHQSLCTTDLEVKARHHHHHPHRHHKQSFNSKYDKFEENIQPEFGDVTEHNNHTVNEKTDQRLFEEFADLYQRRYGLKKLANMSIEMVEPVLKKFQLLFTITEKENKMPLIKSYAEIVKQATKSPTSNVLNNNIIYSEDKECTKSEISFVSCNNQMNTQYDTDFPKNSETPNQTFNTSDHLNEYEDKDQTESMFEDEDTELSENDVHLKYGSNSLKMRALGNINGTMESTGSNGDNDWKGLFGINNTRAANMKLPPLLIHYLFLAKLPVNLMHSCIKKILLVETTQKLSSLSKTSVKQKITHMKEALQYTLQARKFFQRITHGINFQWNQFRKSTSPPVLAPPQECEHSEFVRLSMKTLDCHLSDLLKFYMDCLKEFLNKSCVQQHPQKQVEWKSVMLRNEPRQLLEQEWKFVKAYCHSVKQEEDIVASSFCKLTEHLFDLLKRDIEDENNNFLHLQFEGHISSLSREMSECDITTTTTSDSPVFVSCDSGSVRDDAGSVTSSLSREMSESCQKYNNVCKVLKSRLKQATEFAKLLRADLEISIHIELDSDTTVNNFLTYLSHTKHKLVTLHQPGLDLDHAAANGDISAAASSTYSASTCRKTLGQSELSLVIPDECSTNLVELLHQLTTGFAQQIKENCDQNDPSCCSPINGICNNSQNAGLLNTISRSDINIDDYEKCPREYMLIINKNDKINWAGETYPFVYELDMDNLKQRLETGKILFVARKPDQLLIQLKKFLDQKIVKTASGMRTQNFGELADDAIFGEKEDVPAGKGESNTFKDIIVQPCAAVPDHINFSTITEQQGGPKKSRPLQMLDFQSEACHNNTKRNLNALKSKVIEIGSLLLEKLVVLTKTGQMKVKGALEESVHKLILNSYSILFEFCLDMIRISTGESFKNTIEIRVKDLYEHWFQFVFTSISPPDRPPRCVYGWLGPFFNFLLQIFKTWVPFNMSAKDWKEFEENINKFVNQYVGSSSKSGSPNINNVIRLSFPSQISSTSSFSNCPKFTLGDPARSCSPNPRRRNQEHKENRPDPINVSQEKLSNKEIINKWVPELRNVSKRMYYNSFSDPNSGVSKESSIRPPLFTEKQFSIKTNDSADPALSPIRNSRTLPAFHHKQEEEQNVDSNQSTAGTSCCRRFDKRISHIEEIERKMNEKYLDEKLIGRVRQTEEIMNSHQNPILIKTVPFKWHRKESNCIGSGQTSNVFVVYLLDLNSPSLPDRMAMKEIILSKPITFNQHHDGDGDEYEFLCKLQHDSLVRFYGADISLSHRRLFMEFCAEGTIADICKNEVVESELRRWTKQILSALVYMHGKQIVHRDVKPDNIFLVKPNDRLNVKLGDLGHATQMKQTELGYRAKGVAGTIMYMAPEVVLSNSKDNVNCYYDEKVDIWSMGCVVIYMMTGKPPWSGDRHGIFYNIGLKNKPTNLCNIGREAYEFADKCLSPDCHNRPSGLELMVEEFVQITE